MARSKQTGYNVVEATNQKPTQTEALDAAFPTSAPPDDLDTYEAQSIHIDEDNIRSEFTRVSSDVAFWGKRFARAHRAWLAAKRSRDEVRAMVYLEMRETLESLESKKPTEATINARVETDQRVREAEAHVIECEYERETAKSTCNAVIAKRDMLISLGAVIRSEMAPASLRDPFMKET